MFQAERIMEALELYREESKKLEEHKAACNAAGKEVWNVFFSHRVGNVMSCCRNLPCC